MAQDVTTSAGGATAAGSAFDPQTLTRADGTGLAGQVLAGTGGAKAGGSSVA